MKVHKWDIKVTQTCHQRSGKRHESAMSMPWKYYAHESAMQVPREVRLACICDKVAEKVRGKCCKSAIARETVARPQVSGCHSYPTSLDLDRASTGHLLEDIDEYVRLGQETIIEAIAHEHRMYAN